jgi:hypothetical protein
MRASVERRIRIVNKTIISAVKRVEFVSGGMLYVILEVAGVHIGHWWERQKKKATRKTKP